MPGGTILSIRSESEYVWTGEFDMNTLWSHNVWTRIFSYPEKKKLRIQKYPDTCGRGLREVSYFGGRQIGGRNKRTTWHACDLEDTRARVDVAHSELSLTKMRDFTQSTGVGPGGKTSFVYSCMQTRLTRHNHQPRLPVYATTNCTNICCESREWDSSVNNPLTACYPTNSHCRF